MAQDMEKSLCFFGFSNKLVVISCFFQAIFFNSFTIKSLLFFIFTPKNLLFIKELFTLI